MQLRFFTMPMHPLGKDWLQSLAEDREAFILADELAFTEGYCGEHLTDPEENITSSVMFIASLAHATRRIRPGTGTVNMPNHHPVNLAASLARLDHMLDGRFILGISPGALPSDADAGHPAMFLEAVNHLLAIWRGEAPCNLKGEFWTVSTARTHLPETGMGIIPRPRQPPRAPIVVTAVAPFSQGATEAAARGWDPISANFRMPVWLKSHWQKYVEGCGRAGRAANPANWRIAKTICVAEDDATARRYATDPDNPYRCYYNSLFKKLKRRGALGVFKTRRDQPDDEVTLDDVSEQLIIHGSPQRGAGQVLALREQTGAFGTLLYAGMGWKDRELGRKSMILLAEKVRTLLQAALPPQVAA